MPPQPWPDARITDCPSPNHDSRAGVGIDMLLLHYTDTVDAQAALDILTDPAARVSAHYLVDVDGRVIRLVDEARRAWHAGVAAWRGVTDINACSIGIEIQNAGHSCAPTNAPAPYPEAQIGSLIGLIHDIRARHAIPDRRILGHSDVAPGRKQDPGAHFPWRRLADAGIGIWPPEDAALPGAPVSRATMSGAPESVRQVQRSLAAIGYGSAVDGRAGPQTAAVVAAFQRHFRPSLVTGTTDADTVSRIGVIDSLMCS